MVLPGGDASALAALDSGDIDLAAVGSEAVLRAAAKGQPFEIVYTLMSKVTLQLVVSPSVAGACRRQTRRSAAKSALRR